jgi:hypothetical protein
MLFTLLAPAVAQAQTGNWLEAKHPHVSLFYQPGFEDDARILGEWSDAAERLMKEKYGVSPDHYRMAIYLHPAPAASADVSSAHNSCCRKMSDSTLAGTIDMLAPSAPAFQSATETSSLGLRKSSPDYSAKIFLSEYIPIGHYVAQSSRPSGGWSYYDAPNWFVQGLQEFDAIFHSTRFNRDSTAQRLSAWAVRHRSVFTCCSPDIAIADDYNGGATFMMFLATQFGEGIHARLLRSAAPTFFDALTAETKPYSRGELFQLFERWLERAAPPPPREQSKAPAHMSRHLG